MWGLQTQTGNVCKYGKKKVLEEKNACFYRRKSYFFYIDVYFEWTFTFQFHIIVIEQFSMNMVADADIDGGAVFFAYTE